MLLTLGQAIKPFRWKAVAWVALKDTHLFAIMAKERMPIGLACIGTTSVPGLTIKNNDAPWGHFGLNDVFDLDIFWWRTQSAFVRA